MSRSSGPPALHLIYHFTAVENLPAILAAGGLHCKASARPLRDISDARIQERRARRQVEAGPGGRLHEYVPFYFTPRSPMLHRISKQDRADETAVQKDLVYLVGSVERVLDLGLPYVFTDGHAEMRVDVHHFDDPAALARLDWPVIRAQGWNSDEERRKRQAEFLVHRFAPLSMILGYATQNGAAKRQVQAALTAAGVSLGGKVRPDWYY